MKTTGMKRHSLPLTFFAVFTTAAQAQTPGARLDAAGVALGMSEAQAVAAVAAQPHLSPLKVESLQSQLLRNDLPQPIVHYLTANAKDPGQGIEILHVNLTGQPANPTVWKVFRTVRYPNGQQPTADVVEKSLKQKYGDAPARVDQNGMRMFWVYDTPGRQVTGQAGENLIRKCVSHGLQKLDWASRYDHEFLMLIGNQKERARIAVPAECRQHRFARAQLAVTYGTPLVTGLQVSLVDTALGLPALEATFQMLEGLTESAKQKQIQQGQQIQPRL